MDEVNKTLAFCKKTALQQLNELEKKYNVSGIAEVEKQLDKEREKKCRLNF